MANRIKLTPEKKSEFLRIVAENGGNVTRAAKLIGVAPVTLYDHRQKNGRFAAAWDEAVKRGTDVLIQEAMRRAVNGVVEPVYQGGKLVGHVRRYSDSLLMFLVKGRRPEFKDTTSIAIQNSNTSTNMTVHDRVEKRLSNIRERLGFDLEETFGNTGGK